MSFKEYSRSDLDQEIKLFWKEKLAIQKTGDLIKSKGLPPMYFNVGPNEVDEDDGFEVRSVEACWAQRDDVVAYATGILFGSSEPGLGIDSNQMVIECDRISQHYYDATEMLYQSHAENEPFCETFNESQWITEFCILEVHPSHKGKGIGIKLGLQFIDTLRKNYSTAFIFFKPYPLQYSKGDGPRKYFDPQDHKDAFDRDLKKLFELYRTGWNAKDFPGATDHMWIPGSTGLTVLPAHEGARWTLA